MNDRTEKPAVAIEPQAGTDRLRWTAGPAPITATDPSQGNGSAILGDLGRGPAMPGATEELRAQEFGPDQPGPDDDLDLLDPAWTPPRRAGRLTVLLAAGLLAALGFAGGVLVQKNHDAGLSGAAGAGAASAARQFARANGFAGQGGAAGAGPESGSLPGAGSRTGSAGTGSASGSTGSGAGTGSPVVVGTVVSVGQGSLVVQNFADVKVTVRVPAGTPVTVGALTGLRAGMSVSVTGTKAGDGSVTATSVVSRSNR